MSSPISPRTARTESGPPPGTAHSRATAESYPAGAGLPWALAAGVGRARIAASSSPVTSSMRALSSSSWPSSNRVSRAWWSVNRPCRARCRVARLRRARPRASSASTVGLRCPAISASIIARPETPSTSVSTDEILIRASSSSFSIRCLTRVRSSTRSNRARARSRTCRIASVGTSRPRGKRIRIGAPDPTLTSVSGMAAVSELVERLDVIGRLDAVIGPIKQRRRGHTGGQLLVGMAAAQLAGEDFLVGLDRQRADVAGQRLAPVPGLAATTAAGLARRLSDTQWTAVETGLGDVHTAALTSLSTVAPGRAAGLAGSATIDLDTTDVEVYGRHKRGVAFNHQGQRVGRPHVACWADTATVLAADLLAGNEDPRRDAPALLRRALAALPAPARAGRIRLRADAGYFAGQLARAALFTDIDFAIGARRIAPLWRVLDGLTDTAWTDAIDMA